MPYNFFNEDNEHLLNEFIKTSQYGGVGGQASPWTPGASPVGGGNPSGYEGYGVNDFGIDITLDSIMSRTHDPAPIEPENNMEQRLSSQHKDYEKDMIPYILTFEERLELKTKQKIRNRERYLAEKAKSIFPKVTVQKNIAEVTMEEMLDKRHENQDLKSEFEDKNPDQIKPSRYHPVLSFKKQSDVINRGTTTVFGPHEEDDEREEAGDLSVEKNRLTQPFNGNGTFYTPEDGIDEYLRGITRDTYVDQNSGVRSLSWTYPLEDNIGYHNQNPIPTSPSPLPENLGNVPGETLEQNLSKLKEQQTDRLPTTKFRLQDLYEILRGDPEHREQTMNDIYMDKDPGTSNLPNPTL